MNLTIQNESHTFFQKIKFIYAAKAVGSKNHECAANLAAEYGSK
jgi:hypothetical protein